MVRPASLWRMCWTQHQGNAAEKWSSAHTACMLAAASREGTWAYLALLQRKLDSP